MLPLETMCLEKGKAMLRKWTWAMCVIRLSTSVWKLETNGFKGEIGYLDSRFHFRCPWIPLLWARDKAGHFGWRMQKNEATYCMVAGKGKEKSLGSKTQYSALRHASNDLHHSTRSHLLTFPQPLNSQYLWCKHSAYELMGAGPDIKHNHI